jgi:lysophospholipase L1-like esterase
MIAGSVAAVIVLIGAIIGLYGYAYYHANKRPDNSPSRFLKDKRARAADTKVVVCIGDSITHGRSSCNYVDMLAERLAGNGFAFVNAGINSELAYNVVQRLDEIVECNPDFISIMIGTNDSNKSLTDGDARKAIKQMRLPQRPTADWYRSNLFEICRTLKEKTNASIAILSLPVITEDLSHAAFRHSLPFIDIIREVAEKEGLAYLPLRERMEDFVRERPSVTRHSFARRQSLVKKAFARHFFLKTSWNDIGTLNGFNLLTDFVHLNCRGAEIVAELIEEFIVSEAGEKTGSGPDM